MIACLRGSILYKFPERVILDVGGVGYEISISETIYRKLPDQNEELFLHIYTHVREDTLSLYGFWSLEEKESFLFLLSVSGIGPKLAINILSNIIPSELSQAISSEDLHRLTKLPGVGKKKAERICLELKDKVKFIPQQQNGSIEPTSIESVGGHLEDAVSALINLGYPRNKAEDSIRSVMSKANSDSLSLEDLLRQSLRFLA